MRSKYLWSIGIAAGLLLAVVLSNFGISQVSTLGGLAVAQGTRWNNVRDAAIGDGLTAGILPASIMMFDSGTGTFNRLRGSTTFGILVDVARIQGGTLTVAGNRTPSDTFANPTDAIASFSLLSYWDGTQWVRWRAFQNIDGVSFGGLNSPHTAAINYGFNGSTFDRLRVAGDNGTNPTIGKLAVLPCVALATPITWTDGRIVPCNTTTSGSIRVAQFDVPGSGVSVWNTNITQGLTLFNSETTGAANTAVTVTIPAAGSVRAMLYSLEAQCSGTGTASVTVQDGATTIWTSKGANVPSAPGVFRREWPVPLTGTTNTAMTITLGACGAGSTGTLQVQASRW